MIADQLTEIRHCRCLAARRVSRVITRIYDARLRPHGLRATQFSVLAMLADQGHRSISRLAEDLGVERTTLSRGIALLEAKDLVSASPSDDRRERELALTAAGVAALEAAYPAWKSAQDFVTGKLSGRG